ncbi:reticulon-4-interacting protein 1 homolog, mitochondrial [Bombyx mori]|uniref:Enoyl reductase (ER) domain-containing protein n=1 Tax=Bombyx mori TaxID=7091 RepID=A0A8R2R5D8_BOMMO|nr:reticulon-4-interacting protein 1 homolog, mitochondrial [Bombyx mori]
MDELKHRAGEKFEALHVAARSAADSSKSKVQDVCTQTIEAIRKLREAFLELWQNDLIAEGRERVVEWSREAVKRIKDGALPLSPFVLYEELLALFHDRVWRRSVLIFVCGGCVGGALGVCAGLRLSARAPPGPHARALHSTPDHSVIFVEDAVAPSAGPGEVLVRVQAFSVCELDRSVLRGRGHVLRALLRAGPVTVGRGFAGVVLDVGADVKELELGDNVWGALSEWSGGAAAELLVLPSTRVSKRPGGMSADSAAALPWSGTKVLATLRKLKLNQDNLKGKRVAVCGAARAELCAAVQLLARAGAHVSALAPRHAAQLLRDLGASEFIDPAEGGLQGAARVLEQHARREGCWDAVLLCAGAPAPPSPAVLRSRARRGAVCAVSGAGPVSDRLVAPLAALYAVLFYSYRLARWMCFRGWGLEWLEEEDTLRGGLERLAALVERGDLVPVLDKIFVPQQFEQALAHACSEDAVGATVVRFP